MAAQFNWYTERLKMLESHIKESQDLLGSYEQKLLFEDNPKSIKRYEHEIAAIKESQVKYCAEYEELQARISAGNPISAPTPYEVNLSLVAAVRAGDGCAVLSTIRAGANPNAKDSSGTPALWFAAESGRVDVVNALINAGADISAGNSVGGMPLTVAGRMGHTEIVGLLLAAGVNVNARTGAGHTALINAALNGKTDTVIALIRAGAEVNLQDYHGNTALSRAIAGRHQDTIAVLRNAGATE